MRQAARSSSQVPAQQAPKAFLSFGTGRALDREARRKEELPDDRRKTKEEQESERLRNLELSEIKKSYLGEKRKKKRIAR